MHRLKTEEISTDGDEAITQPHREIARLHHETA
jgi:hypothetical protein